jgi:hypothetical protein
MSYPMYGPPVVPAGGLAAPLDVTSFTFGGAMKG